ncbi:hypothetical protein [Ktedonosporobacter rubrisoli]|uniref:hypothetical protein n=1 Tax=Ktedonosporobacter rubrisoli TaxID=2509675 RepID=UPI0013EED457|nr:hypothetical protein [Ktedonosporobacter rubrisoli]
MLCQTSFDVCAACGLQREWGNGAPAQVKGGDPLDRGTPLTIPLVSRLTEILTEH